jgi:ABC-type polysaccharide/polyol phosphate export permease
MAQGFRLVDLWGTLGWLDVRQRYRRSVIGPFWVTLSLAAFVVGLGVTYGALFGIEMRDYLPYLCIGIVVWTLLSSFILEGCTAFTGAESAIKQMPAPLSVHVYRLIWRSVVIFGHNAVIIALVLAWFGINPGLKAFWAIPGFVLLVVNGLGFSLLFGTLSARFRDIPPLMGNLIQTLFFVTPVIWRADNLKSRHVIAEWNPFYHLIEVVRAPLIEAAPDMRTWLFVLVFTAVNCLVAFVFYARFRWRIPYWL